MYCVERTTSLELWVTGCLSSLHIFIFAVKCPASDCRDSTFKLPPLNLYALILPCLCLLNLKLGKNILEVSLAPLPSLFLSATIPEKHQHFTPVFYITNSHKIQSLKSQCLILVQYFLVFFTLRLLKH